jgi:hypothetical protein
MDSTYEGKGRRALRPYKTVDCFAALAMTMQIWAGGPRPYGRRGCCAKIPAERQGNPVATGISAFCVKREIASLRSQ